ncbi:hypothetical protein [Gluconobacter cerinus]|uniref:hypothetical protein n=1 Tax=Gluconobacter cerinus TaxID=38307 RepID=UPI00207B3C24|nr:hypothetical protein [Gluconobacter cerinus]
MNEDIVALVLLFGFIPALVLGPRLLRARTDNLANQGISDPHLQAALTQAEAHARVWKKGSTSSNASSTRISRVGELGVHDDIPHRPAHAAAVHADRGSFCLPGSGRARHHVRI